MNPVPYFPTTTITHCATICFNYSNHIITHPNLTGFFFVFALDEDNRKSLPPVIMHLCCVHVLYIWLMSYIVFHQAIYALFC